MATIEATAKPKPRFIDKEWLREQIAERNAQTGFVPIPGITAEGARERIAAEMRARGIDPDTLRYEQKYED